MHMNSTLLSSLAVVSTLILLGGCNSNTPKLPDNVAQQQSNTARAFPRAKNPEVVCRNCRAHFKLASAQHKTSHGHNYTVCPVCHHDYSKKAD